MKETKYKKYRSKIGLVVPLVLIVLTCAILLVWLLPYTTSNNDSHVMRIVVTCLIGVLSLIFIWSSFSTYYVITDVSVIAVSGPMKARVRFCNITEIKEGKSLISSLALSIDRVYICYGKGILRRLEVSPKDKQAFIEELNSKLNSYREKV